MLLTLFRERKIRVIEREFRFALLIIAFPTFRDTKDMDDFVRETFKWHLRRASHPPRPLPKECWDLCPSFTLADVEEEAHDLNILEIVEATFYAMVLNDAMELSVVSRDMDGGLKLTSKGLRWTAFKSWLSVSKRALLEAQLCQRAPRKAASGP